MNTSEYIVKRLQAWGIRRVFGYPGDGINGVMGALRRAENEIEFIQVPHEENAAFMACAHAKFTSQVGVCIATSGPGAIHLLNGLYDAKMDHQPVVAIIGQQARTAMGSHYQQEVDLVSLFKDVAGDYVHQAASVQQVRHLVDRAFRIAKSERTVTCIVLPNDLQEETYAEPDHKHGFAQSSTHFTTPTVVPHHTDLAEAARILNEGKKVAILAGAGALGAAEELKQVAELLGAGVAKALLGKAVLADDLPYVTGSIGLLGTKASHELMTGCDTLLMVGTSFPYSEFLPKEGQARGIQIDLNPKMLGIRYNTELNLVGDSRETLQALLPLLRRKEDRSWREQTEENVRNWWKLVEARAMVGANPINPQLLTAAVSDRLPERSIIAADSGTAASWFARNIKIREGMMASLSGTLATMCPAVPYAIAAKFAYPDRAAVALVGDGAMQMLGNNGLITIAKYWKQWSNPQLIIVVLNNSDLNMVTWEQRVTSGDAKFEGSQSLIDHPYAGYAQLLGLDGMRIEKPEMLASGLDWAFQCKKPVVLDVVCDPNVAPLPPHITLEEAKNFAKAMVKEKQDAWDLIKQTGKEAIETLIPSLKA